VSLKCLRLFSIFEGNNYSADWKKEAANRGLTILKNSGYALDAIVSPKNVKMLTDQKIYKKIELDLLHQAKLEKYINALEIEVKTFMDIVKTKVIPIAIQYQSNLVESIKGMREVSDILDENSTIDSEILLKKIINNINEANKGVSKFSNLLNEAADINNLSTKAKYFADNVVPALKDVRVFIDELETILPDETWPLPKYSEMLFII